MNWIARLSLVSTLAFLAAAADVQAQSPSTVTPDRATVLVNKDLAGQRWSIARNVANGTVTGNVFSPGSSAPQFVYCEQTGESSNDYTYRCSGTGACSVADCSTDWDFISQVILPKSFFAAGSGPAPTPVPSGCPANGPITDLTRDCRAYVYFYQQSSVLFGLSTRGNVVATCFASDPAEIFCVAGTVTSSTTANLEIVNLNSGPSVDLEAGGRLSIAGSSLRMNFSLDGTALAVNASWIETRPASSSAASDAGDPEGALAPLLARLAGRTLDAASATSAGASTGVIAESLDSLGAALGN